MFSDVNVPSSQKYAGFVVPTVSLIETIVLFGKRFTHPDAAEKARPDGSSPSRRRREPTIGPVCCDCVGATHTAEHIPTRRRRRHNASDVAISPHTLGKPPRGTYTAICEEEGRRRMRRARVCVCDGGVGFFNCRKHTRVHEYKNKHKSKRCVPSSYKQYRI